MPASFIFEILYFLECAIVRYTCTCHINHACWVVVLCFVLVIYNSLAPNEAIGDIELAQHWLGKWLVSWRHQASTWNNLEISSLTHHQGPLTIHLRRFHNTYFSQWSLELALKSLISTFIPIPQEPMGNMVLTIIKMCDIVVSGMIIFQQFHKTRDCQFNSH